MLRNILAGKGVKATSWGAPELSQGWERRVIKANDWVNKACERWGTIKVWQEFWCHLILWLIFKYQNVTKMNTDLMVFIQEIIYLRQKMKYM